MEPNERKTDEAVIRLVGGEERTSIRVEQGKENPELVVRTLLNGAVAFLAAQVVGQLPGEEREEFAKVFGETMESQMLAEIAARELLEAADGTEGAAEDDL